MVIFVLVEEKKKATKQKIGESHESIHLQNNPHYLSQT